LTLLCSSTPLFPTPPLSPKFPHVPLGIGGWPLGYEERRCWSVQLVSKISNLCDPDPPTSHRRTDGQTDRQTDRRTDNMSSQDRALHYSALRGKNRHKLTTPALQSFPSPSTTLQTYDLRNRTESQLLTHNYTDHLWLYILSSAVHRIGQTITAKSSLKIRNPSASTTSFKSFRMKKYRQFTYGLLILADPEGAKGPPSKLKTIWRKAVRVAVVVTQCFDVGNDYIAYSPPGKIVFSALFCRNSSACNWATVSLGCHIGQGYWRSGSKQVLKWAGLPKNAPKYAFRDPKMKQISGEEPLPDPSPYPILVYSRGACGASNLAPWSPILDPSLFTYSVVNEAHRIMRWRSSVYTDEAHRQPIGTPEFYRCRFRHCRPPSSPSAWWRAPDWRADIAGVSRHHREPLSTPVGWTGRHGDRWRHRHGLLSAGASSESTPGSEAQSAGKTFDQPVYSSVAWRMRKDDDDDDDDGADDEWRYRWVGPQVAIPVHKRPIHCSPATVNLCS